MGEEARKIRVSFSCELKPVSGKQNFAVRLAEELTKIGVKVTSKKPHINLIFVKGSRRDCKNILRLDGVWINTDMDFKKGNAQIRRTIESSSGIIYQNEFCRDSVRSFCGDIGRRSTVIYNGVDPSKFNNPYQHNKPYFLALCKWRPHKRLKEIVNGFLAAGLSRDFDLIVCGKPDFVVKNPSVIYMGNVPLKKTECLVAGCVATVHLAYLDWCPNSVVESLVARKPVLHTDSGGTKFLVKDNGICLPDKKWNFQALALYKPPILNKELLHKGFVDILETPSFERSDLYIHDVAVKYKQFIEEVLDAR